MFLSILSKFLVSHVLFCVSSFRVKVMVVFWESKLGLVGINIHLLNEMMNDSTNAMHPGYADRES